MEGLIKALEFYADEENWRGYAAGTEWVAHGKIEDDLGKRARKALEEYRGVAQSG